MKLVKELIDYGFNTMKLHSIEAVIVLRILLLQSSWRKMFLQEGLLRRTNTSKVVFDSAVYSLLKHTKYQTI
jgi:hypothetical protein